MHRITNAGTDAGSDCAEDDTLLRAGLPAGRVEKTIARSEDTATGDLKTGLIDEQARHQLDGRMSDFVYCIAGPPPTTESVTRMPVVDNQVDIANVHYDRFF